MRRSGRIGQNDIPPKSHILGTWRLGGIVCWTDPPGSTRRIPFRKLLQIKELCCKHGEQVKNNQRIFPKDLAGLKSFKKDYPESTPYLLYRGKERLIIDDLLLKLNPDLSL